MKKHEKGTRVQYYGREFKKSLGHTFTVTAVRQSSKDGIPTGKYYHDLEAVEKPKKTTTVENFDKRGYDYDSHSEKLHSIEFGDLVKA